jgi:20S proteasome subunit alpha 5
MRTGHSCKRYYSLSYSDSLANLRHFFRYHAEPSGTFYRYDAKAIGSGSEGAQAELQNEYHRSLTLAEAETLVLKTLKQVMEEKLDSKNVQLASVTKEKGFRIYGDEEMGHAVAQLGGNQ